MTDLRSLAAVSTAAFLLVATPARAEIDRTDQTRIVNGATSADYQLFQEGKRAFARDRRHDPAFGPDFNDNGCAACHRFPSLGGSGRDYESNLRVGVLDGNGRFVPAPGRDSTIVSLKSTEFQPHRQGVPREATHFSKRQTTPMFGAGMIEALPDAVLLAQADRNDRDGDGISGRSVAIQGRIGRFGSQNQESSLDSFIRHAFEQELGVEVQDLEAGELDAVVGFVRLLRPPSRGEIDDEVRWGEQIFAEVGCADCHTPSYQLPSNAYFTTEGERVDVAALQGVTFSPYSDFLLHDMGPALDDGVSLGNAESYEYRTTPLWGLRFRNAMLHDRRADNEVWALRYHGGEAADAREAAFALPKDEWEAALAFLRSL